MFFGYVLIFIASVSNVLADIPKVVVLSFDGIPFNYIQRSLTPNLLQLIKAHQGAGPIEMQSIFPTKTMVTNTTIATGVYPRVHGVYNDEVFDSDYNGTPPTKDHFVYNKNLLPIWIENQKEGNGRNSGVMMWPGGEYEYQGVRAAHIQPFDETITWETRVDTIVKWLTEDDNKANLVMAYFENFQCNDERQAKTSLKDHMRKIDATIQKLYDNLSSKSIDVEFIVLSDHGTYKVEYNNVVEIDTILKDFQVEDYKIIVSGPIAFIKPKTEKSNAILSAFDSHKDSSKKFIAKNINDIENRLSLAINSLTDVIIVRAYKGYTFYNSNTLAEKVNAVEGKDNFVTFESGYDNNLTSMNTFFTGIGSKFYRIAVTTIAFELFDVYPILKCLLDLRTVVHEEIQPLKIGDAIREILISDIVPKRPEENTQTHEGIQEEAEEEDTNIKIS